MSTFALNCLLLNEDPKRQVFTVEIPKNVSILKDLIKAKKAPHLDDLAASDLILWKLEIPISLSRRTGPEIAEDVRVVQVHLPVEADEGNDLVQPLDAVEKVSDYWEDSPQPKHLHILVQKPSAAEQPDLQSLLSVNCLLLGDDSTKAFTVKIPESENVSVLKKKIKEENAHDLAHLDAKDLILYKVSLSDAEVDALKEATAGSKENSVVPRIRIQPLEEMKAVFPEPLQKNLVHIIFDPHC